MYRLIPGRWYLRYTCRKCKSKQILFPDLLQGTSEISAEYVVACLVCKDESIYDSGEIERYRHRATTAKAR